jgi:hypothetical protein
MHQNYYPMHTFPHLFLNVHLLGYLPTYLLPHPELHAKQRHLSIHSVQGQQLLMYRLQLLLGINSEPQHIATATLCTFHNQCWAKFGLADFHLT